MTNAASFPSSEPRYRWWHGALFFGAVTALSALSSGRRNSRKEQELYEQEKLPVWAPPGVVFPLVWPLNNAALVWGGVRLLNASKTQPHRNRMLALQAAQWALYVSYGKVYFGWRSPVLSAVWTLADFAVSGLGLAWSRRSGDARLPLAYLPITAWTGFASTVALYDALRNRDRLLGTPAPLRQAPWPALEK